MILGGLACFVLWIAYGVIQARRSDSIRNRVSGMSRGARGGLGAALMVFGAGVLVGTGFLLQAIGALTKAGITPLGWVLVAVAGLAFVHAQTMAFAMLVSLAYEGVTYDRAPPSDEQYDKGNYEDEAPPDLR